MKITFTSELRKCPFCEIDCYHVVQTIDGVKKQPFYTHERPNNPKQPSSKHDIQKCSENAQMRIIGAIHAYEVQEINILSVGIKTCFNCKFAIEKSGGYSYIYCNNYALKDTDIYGFTFFINSTRPKSTGLIELPVCNKWEILDYD